MAPQSRRLLYHIPVKFQLLSITLQGNELVRSDGTANNKFTLPAIGQVWSQPALVHCTRGIWAWRADTLDST
jgi:hypothetical protein